MTENERETVYFVIHNPSTGVEKAFLGGHLVIGLKTPNGDLVLSVSPVRERKTDLEGAEDNRDKVQEKPN